MRALQLHMARAISAPDAVRLQLGLRAPADGAAGGANAGGAVRGWRSYICLLPHPIGSCLLTLPAHMRTTLLPAQLTRRRTLAWQAFHAFGLLHPPKPLPRALPAPSREAKVLGLPPSKDTARGSSDAAKVRSKDTAKARPKKRAW